MPGLSGRVLVVDDSKAIRQLIRVNLELEGFEVVTAADGAECLEMVRHVRPDVVTLDVVMPRLDGLRTAARLRADPHMRDLRIAIVSACTHLEFERGEAVGVDGYLDKPFEPVELVRLVRQLMHMDRNGQAGPDGSAADQGGWTGPGGQGSDSAKPEAAADLLSRPEGRAESGTGPVAEDAPPVRTEAESGAGAETVAENRTEVRIGNKAKAKRKAKAKAGPAVGAGTDGADEAPHTREPNRRPRG